LRSLLGMYSSKALTAMSEKHAAAGQALTILLIDDEMDICTVWGMLLEMEGMNVIAAANGEDGVAKALSAKPDVVICDFMMPGMNGLEVCAAIRGEQILQKASIVLWSAARGIDAEGLADSVVEKPVDADEFIKHIRLVALQRRS
jgi:CheY-like chemotaxis protein